MFSSLKIKLGRSTSPLALNGDYGLNRLGRLAWRLLNRLNNSLPNRFLDSRLLIRKFSLPATAFASFQPRLQPLSSPSRALSDLFWLSLPWEKIKNALSGHLRLLDIGCGSGGYLERWQTWGRLSLTAYLGLDLKPHPRWLDLEQKFPFARFVSADIRELANLIPPSVNLIFSQSALEHFEEDLRFFLEIKNFLSRSRSPLVQIHLFPAAACLDLYPNHGLRQYTPRTVSKITHLFPDSRALLFTLGGPHCYRLHQQFITSQDLRPIKPIVYQKQLAAALAADLSSPSIVNPSFYALILESNLPDAVIT